MVNEYLNESLSLLKSINENLIKLVSLMGTQQTEILPDPKKEVPVIKEQVADIVENKVETQTTPIVPVKTEEIEPSQPETKSYADAFSELKELLESDAWPMAVDPDLICHDELDDDKELRAEGIIEFLIDEDLEGKKFLDFGCGEGHVVKKALDKNPSLSRGYDLHKFDSWNKLNFPEDGKHGVSDKWDDVVANGPYDVVLIYDVLDHLEGDQVEELKKIRSVMAPGGRIYVRCHPFCSRHGTHLYKKINKAFVHLVFSDVELARLGLGGGLKAQKIIHPHLIYKQWFNDAGIDLINESAIQENLEDFFHLNPIVNERIKDNWRGVSIDPQLAAGKGFPSYQMRIQFVDYLLKS